MLHAVTSALAAAIVFAAIIGMAPARAEEQDKDANATAIPHFFYNGTSSWLEVMGPMTVSFYNMSDKKVVASVDLKANASHVEGSTSKGPNDTEIYSLAVKFDTPMNDSNGTTIKSITVTLGMEVYPKQQRWSLLTLELNYVATVNVSGTETSLTQTDHPLAFERIGYTTKEVDRQCARGYAVCAPVGLSWTCSSQVAKPKFPQNGKNDTKTNDTKPQDAGKADSANKIEAGITFPGMRLQPFLETNGTQARAEFGNSWDCDPVFSIYLWQGLILSFLMCLVLWWAITMMTTIHINTIFDDPKGPRIMVPTSD